MPPRGEFKPPSILEAEPESITQSPEPEEKVSDTDTPQDLESQAEEAFDVEIDREAYAGIVRGELEGGNAGGIVKTIEELIEQGGRQAHIDIIMETLRAEVDQDMGHAEEAQRGLDLIAERGLTVENELAEGDLRDPLTDSLMEGDFTDLKEKIRSLPDRRKSEVIKVLKTLAEKSSNQRLQDTAGHVLDLVQEADAQAAEEDEIVMLDDDDLPIEQASEEIDTKAAAQKGIKATDEMFDQWQEEVNAEKARKLAQRRAEKKAERAKREAERQRIEQELTGRTETGEAYAYQDPDIASDVAGVMTGPDVEPVKAPETPETPEVETKVATSLTGDPALDELFFSDSSTEQPESPTPDQPFGEAKEATKEEKAKIAQQIKEQEAAKRKAREDRIKREGTEVVETNDPLAGIS